MTATRTGLSRIELPHMPIDVAGELAEHARELDLLVLGPAGQEPGEPRPAGGPGPAGGEDPAARPAALGGELQPGRPRILSVPGPADQARPFELLRLARYRRSVDTELLGQISQPQARPACVEYIKESQAGLIDIDTRLGEQELVQPDLLERAAKLVQRRLDLADGLVMPGLGGAEG